MSQTFTAIPNRVNGTEADANWWNILRAAGVSLENGLVAATNFTIANNQASPTNVTGLTLDGAVYGSARIDIQMKRSDATPTELVSYIQLFLTYKSSGWVLEQVDHGDDAGVEFSVTTSLGVAQIKYTSTNMAGGSYSGAMKYFAYKFGV